MVSMHDFIFALAEPKQRGPSSPLAPNQNVKSVVCPLANWPQGQQTRDKFLLSIMKFDGCSHVMNTTLGT